MIFLFFLRLQYLQLNKSLCRFLAKELHSTSRKIKVQPLMDMDSQFFQPGIPAREHFSWLRKLTPCFGIDGSQVEIIKEPSGFYQTLLAEAGKAKKRIVISSLYLGISPLEKQLVDSIHRNTQQQSGLQVQVLLDFTRGSRGEHNSRTMLLPLLKDFSEQVNVSLYHSPDLRGIRKRWLPERWNEVIGLQHMKVYLFDDNLLLSGANLSETYFTNRQDRYVMFRNCSKLADFFHNLVSCVASVSFNLNPDNTVGLPADLVNHPFEGENNGAAYRSEVKEKLTDILEPSNYWSFSGVDSEPDLIDSSKDVDTWIFPLVQMAPFGITTDDLVTQRLFHKAPKEACIKLASGYFNLTDHYLSAILNESFCDFNILTAAPEANGFFGARGVSGAIPDAYTYITKQFYEEVSRQEQQDRIRLQEYSWQDWTFHGKGLWYYLPHHNLPSMSLIGSPNFGYRSVFRDLEAQVAIVTENTQLQTQLHLEQNDLYKKSSQVTASTFLHPNRHIPLWVSYVTPIIRNFF